MTEADNSAAGTSFASVLTSISCSLETQTPSDIPWSKSLEKLPAFTIKKRNRSTWQQKWETQA